jgi:hypothetical protein
VKLPPWRWRLLSPPAVEVEVEVTVGNLNRVVNEEINGKKKNLLLAKRRKSLAKKLGFPSESNTSKNCPSKIFRLIVNEPSAGNSKNFDRSLKPLSCSREPPPPLSKKILLLSQHRNPKILEGEDVAAGEGEAEVVQAAKPLNILKPLKITKVEAKNLIAQFGTVEKP